MYFLSFEVSFFSFRRFVLNVMLRSAAVNYWHLEEQSLVVPAFITFMFYIFFYAYFSFFHFIFIHSIFGFMKIRFCETSGICGDIVDRIRSRRFRYFGHCSQNATFPMATLSHVWSCSRKHTEDDRGSAGLVIFRTTAR